MGSATAWPGRKGQSYLVTISQVDVTAFLPVGNRRGISHYGERPTRAEAQVREKEPRSSQATEV